MEYSRLFNLLYCTHDGVDDVDKILNSLSNLNICHVNTVSLNKIIDELEELLNKLSIFMISYV